jgi:hypothetical protein
MLGKTYHTYNGESITTKTFIKNGQKEYEQVEYQLPYKPTNIPGAIVCGNGLTRRKFFKMIQLVEAGGGLLRENKPEVYACNAAYTERATIQSHFICRGMNGPNVKIKSRMLD